MPADTEATISTTNQTLAATQQTLDETNALLTRKPITVRLNDEEAQLLEQAARIDAVSQNEFVRQAVLDRIAAARLTRHSKPRSVVRSRPTSRSSSGSRRRDRPRPLARG